MDSCLSSQSLSLLSAPLEGLSDRQLALAVDIAWHAGGEACDAAQRVLPKDRARHLATERDYLRIILSAAYQDGIIAVSEIQGWRHQVKSGNAITDPRVQAFCASWSLREALYQSDSLRVRKAVLARSCEVGEAQVEIAGVGPCGIPLLRCDGKLHLVLTYSEAEEIGICSDHVTTADEPSITALGLCDRSNQRRESDSCEWQFLRYSCPPLGPVSAHRFHEHLILELLSSPSVL